MLAFRLTFSSRPADSLTVDRGIIIRATAIHRAKSIG